MRALYFLIILFFLTGCFKRNEAHVNVRCTDSCITFNIRVSTGLNSATALANTPVELGWSRPATPLGDPGRLIAKGTASNNGFISFSFKAKAKELQGGKFYVTARKGVDYFFQENGYYGIQKYDSIVTANIHVPSKATIKIVYKNFTPVTANDFFQCLPYFITYGSSSIPIEMKKSDGQLSNTFFFTSDGSFSRLELTGKTAGDQYTYFDIINLKNGTRVHLRDSLYIGKGETKTYEVEF
jgi:hypothetical protein